MLRSRSGPSVTPDIFWRKKHDSKITKKLIAVSMVSLCIVLFCIFRFVGILNYQKMVSDVVEETVQSFQALARTQNKTFETCSSQ